MLIKKPLMKIDKDEPFKEDILYRSESAKILTELLRSIDIPFVFAVDSGWGTGKTVFLKMWKQALENEGFHCLYFNAWENDFADDPLISFIAEMQSGIDILKSGDSKAKEYFDKAKKIGVSLAKKVIPVAVKIGTAGVLDLASVSEGGLSDLAAKIAEERIDKYEAYKNTIEEFKKTLDKFFKEIDGGKKPLVFFIDELDRCRPIYAIDLLERIKHLFDIYGIVFVLALDKAQIAHSIKALYGIGMDVDGYLRRFIDLDYKLPKASTEIYCKYLFKIFGFDDYFSTRKDSESDIEALLHTFINLSQIFNFSLRVQEQCFTQFSIVLRTTPRNIKLFPLLLATLIALKASDASLYLKYVNRNISSQDILDYIKRMPNGTDFLNKRYGQVIEAYLISSPCDEDKLESIVKEYSVLANKLTGAEKTRVEKIKELLTNFLEWNHYGILDSLIKKIEITERFTT